MKIMNITNYMNQLKNNVYVDTIKVQIKVGTNAMYE